MQRKTIWIISIIILLAAIGNGGYYLYQRQQAHALYEQAQQAYAQKDYQKSLEFCRKITPLQLRLLPKLEQANALINAGNCLYEMEKYADGIDYFARAAEIVEKNDLLAQIEAPTQLYNRWGECYEAGNQYDNAKEIYLRGMNQIIEVYGSSYQGITLLRARLGEIYLYLGDYKKSLGYWERVIEDKNYIDEQSDSAKALIYHYTASAYCHNDLLDKSLEMCAQSSYYTKKCYGEHSDRMALEYSGVAAVYYKQKNISRAIELLDKALFILEKGYGKDYYVTQRIAELRYKCEKELSLEQAQQNVEQKNYSKAIEYIDKIQKTYSDKQTFCKDYPDAIGCFQLLAVCFQNLKQYDKAEENFRQALYLTIEKYGKNHFSVATAYYGLGKLALDREQPDVGIVFFNKGLAVLDAIPQKDSLCLAKIQWGIAQAYEQKKDYLEAIIYAKKSLAEMTSDPIPEQQQKLNSAIKKWEQLDASPR